jgi:DNA-binding response OmpR family regulator
MRVLVVEDNPVVADAVAEGLRDQGMAVDTAYDGSAGLEKAAVNTYDVVVLDRDLPRLHGDVLCRQIVDSPGTSRILMLTAAALVGDRVEGLNLGADDYLVKPFDFAELVARVRALARRSPSTPPVLTRGDLAVDRARRAVTRAGRPVLLARKELGVLEVLVCADGAVVTAELLLWSIAGLGVGTIVAGLLGWGTGRRILLPLHTVTAAARRTSQEHLGERISFDGADDELKELADTFDDMLARLDRAFASQRRFVANAAHELRTPLTSARTLIDVAMAKPARTTGQLEVLAAGVRRALGQSEALIEGLLTLARSDRGLVSYEPADLEAAAQDAIEQVSATASESGIVIDARLSPSPALGDRVLLERLAANLLDNAVCYNVTGGSVRVVTGSGDGESYITVTNTGPLVPQSAVASLFEPFTRLDGRVGNGQGVGLGLSIVASVVSAHDGHLEAEALPSGGMTISARVQTPAGQT